MKQCSVVWCRLPKAGLGNQLFPLMKAMVFAHLNNFPLIVTHYHQVKIGPYLRGERTKRKYHDHFTFQKGVVREYLDRWKVRPSNFKELIEEPSLVKVEREATLYFFHRIPHWKNYFDGLTEHRTLVIELFYSMLKPAIIEKLNNLVSPEIGVHIRLGDFRKLKENESFAHVGAVRTPQSFFADAIKLLRSCSTPQKNVTVFTDGSPDELEEVLKIPNTLIEVGNTDIVDLLQLSRSKLIVVSAGSTFGYWAGFLSDSPVIFHPDHPCTIRADPAYFEGTPSDYKLRVNK